MSDYLTKPAAALSDREKTQKIMYLLMAEGLDQAAALEVLHDAGEKFPGAAADVETSDELELDAKPLFSRSDTGTWVSAWVYVPDPEMEEEK